MGSGMEKNNNSDDLNALSFYPFENTVLVEQVIRAQTHWGTSSFKGEKSQKLVIHIFIWDLSVRYSDDSQRYRVWLLNNILTNYVSFGLPFG